MAEEMIKKKEFRYRGKSIEELKEMDIREFAKLLRATERRTLLRQSDETQKFLIKCSEKTKKKKQIKTHDRSLIIVPKMIGLRIQIHDGKSFNNLDVTAEMLGHRLGEFAVTRNKVKHGAAGVGATRSSAATSK